MPSKIFTAYADAKIKTDHSKFGGASGLFDGVGDYISTPDHDDFNFFNGDFTIDFWWYPIVKTGYQNFYTQAEDANNFIVFVINNGVLVLYVNDNGTYKANHYSAIAVNINTWYHIAFVRTNNIIKIFLNGSALTVSVDATLGTTKNLVAPVCIGGRKWPGIEDRFINGYIDELRISKGIARWTSSFTPSVQPYITDQYTILLMHMDGVNNSTVFEDSANKNYKTSGMAIYGPFDLASVISVSDSKIVWEENIPQDTTLTVKIAISNNGSPADSDYNLCTNGESIPAIIHEDDLAGKTLYIKITMGTSDVTSSPSLLNLRFEVQDKDDEKSLSITLTGSGRMRSPQGDVNVNYNASAGNLISDTGAVLSFIQTFVPTGLTPLNNPNISERVEVSSITGLGVLTRIYYINTKEDEYLEISNITATGTLIHINDL